MTFTKTKKRLTIKRISTYFLKQITAKLHDRSSMYDIILLY